MQNQIKKIRDGVIKPLFYGVLCLLFVCQSAIAQVRPPAEERLKENLAATIERFDKDVMVVETAYPWRPNNDDPTQLLHKQKLRPLVPGLPACKSSQKAFLEALIETVRQAPNGHGKGVFYWAPEYIPSDKLKPGRAHLSLFDEKGNVLPGMEAFRTKLSENN